MMQHGTWRHEQRTGAYWLVNLFLLACRNQTTKAAEIEVGADVNEAAFLLVNLSSFPFSVTLFMKTKKSYEPFSDPRVLSRTGTPPL